MSRQWAVTKRGATGCNARTAAIGNRIDRLAGGDEGWATVTDAQLPFEMNALNDSSGYDAVSSLSVNIGRRAAGVCQRSCPIFSRDFLLSGHLLWRVQPDLIDRHPVPRLP